LFLAAPGSTQPDQKTPLHHQPTQQLGLSDDALKSTTVKMWVSLPSLSGYFGIVTDTQNSPQTPSDENLWYEHLAEDAFLVL
jgi:hypothetical protein